MSQFAIAVGAIFVIVAAIAIWAVWRRRKKIRAAADIEKGQTEPQLIVESQPPSAMPEPSAEAESISAPPGVRLDEKAEIEAASLLAGARKDRKLQRLREGLAPTRGGLIKKISAIFEGKKEIDSSLVSELEEALITADVGAKTTDLLITFIKESLDRNELAEPRAVWDFLRDKARHILSVDAEPMRVSADKPYVIMVIGVNGVGKTTTIGKLATRYSEQGHRVVLAAADTFRAAAVNQLAIWGQRANAEVVKSDEGADPSSVVFDAIKNAKESKADIVMVDTAGRLHTKVPLMEELKKIKRVINKSNEKAPHEVILVLDATTGQNAVQQVAMFKEALGVTGLVLTKLDGTAKGGVIIGICNEHKIPIRFIGIGEAKDDLREFDVEDFLDALFLLKEEEIEKENDSRK